MPGGIEIAAWVLRGLGVYAALGAVFAVWFVVSGVGRISPAARGTGWAFRLLIGPGSAVLWPVLVFELVASRGRGGVVVGRVLRADDVETALDDVETDDGTGAVVEPGTRSDANAPARFVDPEAETDAGLGTDLTPGVDRGRGAGS